MIFLFKVSSLSTNSKMNDFVCYIRRPDGNGWVRARTHHRQALESFLLTPVNNMNIGVYVSVPHEDGDNFEATFHHRNIEDIGRNRQYIQNMATYVDYYGRNVEIILANSGYVAYINRLID